MRLVYLTKDAVVGEGAVRVKMVDGVPVMVLRYKGELYAYVAACPHDYCVYFEPQLKDSMIHCMCHGELFKPESGEPTKGLAKEPLIKLRVESRDGKIYVEAPGRDILEKLVERSRRS